MTMERVDCDFSPMKQQLREDLAKIVADIEQSLDALDHDSFCLLGTFERIKEQFAYVETTAASFYLHCYLSPFTDTYRELTLALQNLSRRRHGALIVVQRQDPVKHLLQPGIPIGAAFTHSLLESIFIPGSPLHDGAVLVRSNKIVSAAHVLPLPAAHTGGKHMGTRHRAAIGLTERSDALVLVVSEETGRTSFALDGKLFPVITHV
jgi:diadenylate cyclase